MAVIRGSGTSANILYGTANPTDSQGGQNDWFIRVDSNGNAESFWVKGVSTWTKQADFNVVNILYGTADPGSGTGTDNDWYIKTNSSGNAVSLWQRSSGSWTKQADIPTASGSGIDISFGTTAPAGADGSINDWYLRVDGSGNVTAFYEKTASTTWTKRADVPTSSGAGIGIDHGTGVPGSGDGSMNDWYFRLDSEDQLIEIYEKTSGTAWTKRADRSRFLSAANLTGTSYIEGDTVILEGAATGQFSFTGKLTRVAETTGTGANLHDNDFGIFSSAFVMQADATEAPPFDALGNGDRIAIVDSAGTATIVNITGPVNTATRNSLATIEIASGNFTPTTLTLTQGNSYTLYALPSRNERAGSVFIHDGNYFERVFEFPDVTAQDLSAYSTTAQVTAAINSAVANFRTATQITTEITGAVPVIHDGTTAPANATGKINDLYIQRDSAGVLLALYEKTGSTTWTNRGSALNIHDGTTAPGGSDGRIGDWYVQRNSSGNVTSLHEKTASTTWTNRGNIPAGGGGSTGTSVEYEDNLSGTYSNGDIVILKSDATAQTSYTTKLTRTGESGGSAADFEAGEVQRSSAGTLYIDTTVAESSFFTNLRSGDSIVLVDTTNPATKLTASLTGTPTLATRNSIINTVSVASGDHTWSGSIVDGRSYTVYAVVSRNEQATSVFQHDGNYFTRLTRFPSAVEAQQAAQQNIVSWGGDANPLINSAQGKKQFDVEISATSTNWTAGTAYTTISRVYVPERGTYYQCTTNHTAAASFDTDLTAGRWDVIAGYHSENGENLIRFGRANDNARIFIRNSAVNPLAMVFEFGLKFATGTNDFGFWIGLRANNAAVGGNEGGVNKGLLLFTLTQQTGDALGIDIKAADGTTSNITGGTRQVFNGATNPNAAQFRLPQRSGMVLGGYNSPFNAYFADYFGAQLRGIAVDEGADDLYVLYGDNNAREVRVHSRASMEPHWNETRTGISTDAVDIAVNDDYIFVLKDATADADDEIEKRTKYDGSVVSGGDVTITNQPAGTSELRGLDVYGDRAYVLIKTGTAHRVNVYNHTLSSAHYVSGESFDCHTSVSDGVGICRVGDRILIADDATTAKVHAYTVAGTRSNTDDFNLTTNNQDPTRMTRSKTKVLVLDTTDRLAYAYNRSDVTRQIQFVFNQNMITCFYDDVKYFEYTYDTSNFPLRFNSSGEFVNTPDEYFILQSNASDTAFRIDMSNILIRNLFPQELNPYWEHRHS